MPCTNQDALRMRPRSLAFFKSAAGDPEIYKHLRTYKRVLTGNLRTLIFSPNAYHRYGLCTQGLCSESHFLFLFYFKRIYFSWSIITILWWALRYISMSQPWVSVCSPSWPPPSCSPVLPGCQRALSLGALLYTSDSHWHMAVCMFQWYSLKASHPLFFPLSPKSVLYICVSFLPCM